MTLSGQEYVDLYAADVKAQLAKEGKFAGPVPAGAKAPGGREVPDVSVPEPTEDDEVVDLAKKLKEDEKD